MNIPTKIMVGSKAYSVEVVEAMLDKAEMGNINLRQKRIRIGETSNVTGAPYTEKQKAETFWHEVVHAILHDMKSPLYRNEKFVDGFSSRLTKVVLTSKA